MSTSLGGREEWAKVLGQGCNDIRGQKRMDQKPRSGIKKDTARSRLGWPISFIQSFRLSCLAPSALKDMAECLYHFISSQVLQVLLSKCLANVGHEPPWQTVGDLAAQKHNFTHHWPQRALAPSPIIFSVILLKVLAVFVDLSISHTTMLAGGRYSFAANVRGNSKLKLACEEKRRLCVGVST